MNKNPGNDKDPEGTGVSGDTQDETSLLEGQPDVRADRKTQQGARIWHRYKTLTKTADSLQFGLCKQKKWWSWRDWKERVCSRL